MFASTSRNCLITPRRAAERLRFFTYSTIKAAYETLAACIYLPGVNDDSLMTDDDALGIIVRQKGLNFAPGSACQYSNSGHVSLSLILRRITGETLADFETKNIFVPLGMTHTRYRDDQTALIPHRAFSYSQGANGDYRVSVPYTEGTGAGMLQTTIEEPIKWD